MSAAAIGVFLLAFLLVLSVKAALGKFYFPGLSLLLVLTFVTLLLLLGGTHGSG